MAGNILYFGRIPIIQAQVSDDNTRDSGQPPSLFCSIHISTRSMCGGSWFVQIYLAAALLFASAHAQRDALLTTEDELALDVDLTETASCKGMPTDVFNPDCSLTTNKLDEIASQIVFVGKSSHPIWKARVARSLVMFRI
jgi:hypothetical protein